MSFSSVFVHVKRIFTLPGFSKMLVTMKLVDNSSSYPKSRKQLARLCEACWLVNNSGYVFMDFRFANVLFPNDPNSTDLKLVDADMLAPEKSAFYPVNFVGLPVIKARHADAYPQQKAKQEHDWQSVLQMVQLLTGVSHPLSYYV